MANTMSLVNCDYACIKPEHLARVLQTIGFAVVKGERLRTQRTRREVNLLSETVHGRRLDVGGRFRLKYHLIYLYMAAIAGHAQRTALTSGLSFLPPFDTRIGVILLDGVITFTPSGKCAALN